MSKSRDIADSAATINFIDTVTSNIQTQLDAKAGLSNPTFTGTVAATAFTGDGSALTGVDSLPSQTGNSGKFLTTNGSAASWGAVPASAVAQVKYSQQGSYAGGTTILPSDNSIPQNTEGDQYLSLSITPTNAANILVIQVSLLVLATTPATLALFVDSTANALAATADDPADGGTTAPNQRVMTLTHHVVAGGTSALTFKVRAGHQQTNIVPFRVNSNGNSTGSKYGSRCASSITIWEVTP